MAEVIPVMKGKGFTVYGTELNEEAHALDKVEKQRISLIMGNEGQGVSQEILSSTDQNVYPNERKCGIIECRSRSRDRSLSFSL